MARGDAYVIDAKQGKVVSMKRRVYLKLSKQLKGKVLVKAIATHYAVKESAVESFLENNRALDKEFKRRKS